MLTRPATRQRRCSSAFTLIEILVVIAIIVVLVGILLTAIGAARRAARSAASMAQLKELGAVMLAYTNDNEQRFLNPFRATWPMPGSEGGTPHVSTDLVSSNDPAIFWKFGGGSSDPASRGMTDYFAYYWWSYLAEYRNGSRADKAGVSPADAEILDLMHDADDAADLGTLWPTSYAYCPLLWGGGHIGQFPRSVSVSAITQPQAKVMLWETRDFQRTDRESSGTVARSGHPPWNSPRARPRVALVDGSVTEADIADIMVRAVSPHEGGLMPAEFDEKILARPIHAGKDELPAAVQRADVAAGPLFFWATAGGLGGRDLPK